MDALTLQVATLSLCSYYLMIKFETYLPIKNNNNKNKTAG